MSLFSMAREKLRGKFGKNVAAMYVQHGGSILLPLINLPYLARILTPSSWGTVLFAQAYALYLTIFIQYGFNTAASREIARSRATGDGLAVFVSEVMGAKLLLAFASLLVSVIVWRCVGPFHQSPRVFWCAVAWGICQGLFYTWYFQGIEKLHFISLIEVGARALAVVATFLFVHKPADNWIVMLLLAGSSLLTLIAGVIMTYQDVPVLIPSVAGSVKALRLSWHRFVFELASTLYTTSGTLFAGLFAAARVVAFYNNADRLTRTMRVSLDPVMRAAFPRVSSLTANRMDEATIFARRIFLTLGGLSVLMGIGSFAFAPIAVRLVFGSKYMEMVPILRILSFVIPMHVATTVLGYVWAYPLGFDREVTRVMLLAAVLNAALAVSLVPFFGAIGMAVATVLSNIYVLWSHIHMLRRASLLPVGRAWLINAWSAYGGLKTS
jgi:PST family polysaccharide transporter